MKVAETSKNLGVSPLQSQVIQNLDTQKRCFLGTFLEKIAILTLFNKTNCEDSIAVGGVYIDIVVMCRLDLEAALVKPQSDAFIRILVTLTQLQF